MTHASVNISILITLSLILCAQLFFSPILLNVVLILMILTRYFIWRRRKISPKIWTYSLIALGFISIFFSYQTLIGVEAGVAILTLSLFAKSLETHQKRDAIILFNFALFVTASLFLYTQAILMAVMVILLIISCFVGLYRLQICEFNVAEAGVSLKNDATHIAKIIGYALPFFILLFLFFPRLPPLWHIPVPDQKGVTGMSDTMSPGDLAELSQSGDLAFRILGDMTQLPPRHALYWRAMVLDRYDGQKWTNQSFNQMAVDIPEQTQPQYHYQYLANDARVMWTMGLDQSIPQQRFYFLRRDGGIMSYRPHSRVQPVSLVWVGQIKSKPLSERATRHFIENNTQYIDQLDPKAQQLAQQIWQQVDGNPEQYIQAILKWYRQKGFAYTLEPGTLGSQRIDEFLFSARQGFCEHYASSFTMLMRYAGVPARVVIGYQGGELAPDGKSWEVRQLDAHAWSEVYLNGQWQRYDPTAMIAPERIQDGMQNLMQQDSTVGANNGYQNLKWLHTVRVWTDYVGYQWQSKIVGYDADDQQNWLSKLGLRSSHSLVWMLVLGILALLAVYFLYIYYQAIKQISAYDRALQQFNKKLLLEHRKQPSETISHWMLRLSKDVAEADQKLFSEVAQLDQIQRYSVHTDHIKIQEFKGLLKKCSNALGLK